MICQPDLRCCLRSSLFLILDYLRVNYEHLGKVSEQLMDNVGKICRLLPGVGKASE